MTDYAKVDGHTVVAYPYSDAQMKRDNPNVSFPAFLDDATRAEFGVLPVDFTEPTYDPNRAAITLRDFADWSVGASKVTATYASTTLTLAQRREPAIAALKQKRWEIEVGGVTVEIGGEPVLVSTARGDDRLNMFAEYTAAITGQRQDGATFNFADGVPRSVSNADIIAAFSAGKGRIQEAFDREGVVTGLLEAASTHVAMDDAIAAIDSGWPN